MMARSTYALLALGRARSKWLATLSSWVNCGSLPADLSKCLSLGEVRQRLGGLQSYSALIVESTVAGLDRDLISVANHAGVSVIVVDAVSERHTHWSTLGAAAVVTPDTGVEEFLYILSTHARMISSATIAAVDTVEDAMTATGKLVAVVGSGGTGTSTIAIAIAQLMADDITHSELVVLADFARNGEQAMLHDTNDVVPGVEELIDSTRSHSPSVDDVRNLTFHIASRRYRLLLGQRRAGAWTAMTPTAITHGLQALRRSFLTVIADITADFESERDGGSIDVEERNGLARLSVSQADIVVVVAVAGMKGAHATARVIRETIALGVAAERVVVVINRVGRDKRIAVETAGAIEQLIQEPGSSRRVGATVVVPHAEVDLALRDGARLPKRVTQPLIEVIRAIRATDAATTLEAVIEPEPVVPGSLGMLDEAS